MSENIRSTKEIVLASGDTLIVHTYITGAEKRTINEVMLREIEMRQTGGSQEITGFKGVSTFEMENKAIECVVVEARTNDTVVTGSKNILQFVLSQPIETFDEIMKIVEETTNPKVVPTS